MSKRAWLAVVAVAFVIGLTATERAWALPPFARKYKTSCATCHEVYPRLNAVGEAFRLNGYKFIDDELYIKEKPVELGAEAYKRVWPRAIWPSDIPGLPPISLRVTSDLAIDAGGTKDARTSFNAPREIALLGAGALGEHMSAFAELGFVRASEGLGHGHARGDEAEEGEEQTDVEVQGWVQIEDVAGPENAMNLRIGTVGMHEMGLFTARDHNRVSINTYLYSSWTMPLVEGADMEGNPFIIHAQPGVEVNGFGPRWRYAVGIVNGNGERFSDNNSQKDFYVQLAYKLGGLGFDGSGMEEALEDASAWRDDSVTVSVFAHRGTFPVEVDGNDDDDHFWRIGPGILWRTGDLQLGAGYAYGKNDKPFGNLSGKSVESHSWFVEATYFLYPWLIPYARYEALDLDLPSLGGGEEHHSSHEDEGIERGDRARIIVGTKMLLRANVTLAVEARIYTENDVTDDTDDDDQVAISIEFAF